MQVQVYSRNMDQVPFLFAEGEGNPSIANSVVIELYKQTSGVSSKLPVHRIEHHGYMQIVLSDSLDGGGLQYVVSCGNDVIRGCGWSRGFASPA